MINALKHGDADPPEDMCETCHVQPKAEPHTCPFRRDIDNDNITTCTCCDACEHECAMDI
jgi:hypothetical protein